MQKPVYLDYNATTPLHPAVKKAMIENMDVFGNASSMHFFGREAKQKVEQARQSLARLINASAEEIVFTGGGSESNNAIIKTFVCPQPGCDACRNTRSQIITTNIEHPSVLNTVQSLSSRAAVITVGVDRTGRVDLAELKKHLSKDTALVSVMLANNEIGTIQDIALIAKLSHEAGAYLHCDAVQGLGKIPVDVRLLNADFMSFSAHKIYGPKGIGAMYIKRGSPFCPLIEGGHQEEGRRAGTINALGILGFGEAARLCASELETNAQYVQELRDRLRAGLLERVPDVMINGDEEHQLPNTLNLSFLGAEGESILLYLDLEGIAVSTGSACASGSLEPSHVIIATGVGSEAAHGSVRFSLGRDNTQEEIDYVIEKLPPVIKRIRSMSTVYAK